MKFPNNDGASSVDGHVVRELCKLLKVGKTKSSCLNLQGDGISESMVEVLHSAVYAARRSVNSSAGFAPSQMVLRSHIKLPVDLLTTKNIRDLQDKPRNHSQRQA